MNKMFNFLIVVTLLFVPGLLISAIVVALASPKYRAWAIRKITRILDSVQKNLSLMAQANREIAGR